MYVLMVGRPENVGVAAEQEVTSPSVLGSCAAVALTTKKRQDYEAH
jgi:hypothetical protein